jgi:putative transcriptional regulator
MTKAFESIKQGLQEAIAHSLGKAVAVRTHRPAEIDVAALRRSLGFTQMEFAAKFSISIGTLRHWERGDRSRMVRRWPCFTSLPKNASSFARIGVSATVCQSGCVANGGALHAPFHLITYPHRHHNDFLHLHHKIPIRRAVSLKSGDVGVEWIGVRCA